MSTQENKISPFVRTNACPYSQSKHPEKFKEYFEQKEQEFFTLPYYIGMLTHDYNFSKKGLSLEENLEFINSELALERAILNANPEIKEFAGIAKSLTGKVVYYLKNPNLPRPKNFEQEEQIFYRLKQASSYLSSPNTKEVRALFKDGVIHGYALNAFDFLDNAYRNTRFNILNNPYVKAWQDCYNTISQSPASQTIEPALAR